MFMVDQSYSIEVWPGKRNQNISAFDHFPGFFVVSCGFGLIEQAAHRAANQVDHGDEVGLVPVASGA